MGGAEFREPLNAGWDGIREDRLPLMELASLETSGQRGTVLGWGRWGTGIELAVL